MMIRMASPMMYRNVLGPNVRVNQLGRRRCVPRNCANVGMIIIIDEAKITGMTPAMLTLSGMNVLGAAHHAAADHALGVLHRDAPLAGGDPDDADDRRRAR